MIRFLLLIFFLLLYPTSSYTKEWPVRPIKIIVPFPIGGANDFIARAFSENLSKHLNVNVIITNSPGAGSTAATIAYINSPFDDHSFLLSSSNNIIFSPILTQKHKIEELKYIVLTGRGNYYLILRPEDTLDTLKKSKRKLFYGSGGINTGSHLAMISFIKNNKVEMTHIPYPGTRDAMLALLRKEVDMFMISSLATINNHISTGEIKVVEQSKEVYSWYGIVSRKEFSEDKTLILINALKEIYRSKSMHKILEEQGMSPIWFFGKDFENFVYEEYEKWNEILKK